MTRTQSRICAALALAAVIATGLAAPALAGDARASRPGAAAGMQVAIDPATHQLRQPTAAEAQALTAQGAMTMAKSGEPQLTAFADGTLSAVLTADYPNVR